MINKIDDTIKDVYTEFNEWDEIENALTDEIIAAHEKQTEISLFDGKRSGEKDTTYYYKFSLTENEYIDPNNIIEIRYKDKIIDNASLKKIKNLKAIVSIPKSATLPKRIPVLILVNDPSFILQRLKEAIDSIHNSGVESLEFINTIFGSKTDINSIYDEPVTTNVGDFSYNNQQLDAIKKSVSNKVLFIWGPPGTGKTTVLGKIISDYVKKDESVLLCSNTNRAVDVSILKALEVSMYETTPIKEKSLRWGNVFLTEEEDLQYVTLNNHVLRKVREKESKIQNEVDLLTEYKSATKSLNEYKIKNRPYHLAKRRFEELSGKDELNDFQKNEQKRLEKRLKELQSDVGSIEDKIDELAQDVKIIEDRIKDFFDSVQALRQFVINETMVTTDEILRNIRFQAATFARSVLEEKLLTQKFDNVLIDEASMANLPYILYLCTLAKKRIIFVGDPQQLAPIVLSHGGYSEKWLKKDIFLNVASVDDIVDLFQWQNDNSDISVLLTDQYRMPQKVFNIVNDLFYSGRLVNRTDTIGSIKVIDTSEINPSLTFPSVKIKSPINVNHSELLIEDISNSLRPISDKMDAAKSIGVMVPFTQHKRFIQYLSQVRYLPNSLEIGVVHTFQGREKPKVYFDLTLSNIDFTYPTFDEYKTSKTDVSRLLNVALSRCQSSIEDYFDGEFILIANIEYFRRYHPNGIVSEFIDALIENADSVVTVSDPVNPFKLDIEEDEQLDVFEKVAKEDGDEEIDTTQEEIEEINTDHRIQKEIEKYCEKITKEIQLINHYANKIKGKDIFNYTTAINEVLATLPVSYCKGEDSFKLFIDRMFKLTYESSGGKEAVYPIWDRNAKYGKESYGKIRLVIHQLRQFYFHDYENWDKAGQDKLLAHVNEFFNITIGNNKPEIEDEWLNCQLAVLFKTTEYLIEVREWFKHNVTH